MRIKRIAKLIKRQGLKFLSLSKRALKFVLYRNRHSRAVRKTLKLEAHIALVCFVKFIRKQFMIRPRLRFATGFILALIIAYLASAQAVAYLESKEDEIKINGQRVLVADKTGVAQPDPEISQAVTSKRSPFDFKRPVEGGYISQGYLPYHRANDIATDLGAPINPLGPGVVEFAGRVNDGKGNIVVINHGDGLKSLYAHMGYINVGVGNQVTTSAVIGSVGLTGRTTGAHVHLEIIDNDKLIDPASVLE